MSADAPPMLLHYASPTDDASAFNRLSRAMSLAFVLQNIVLLVPYLEWFAPYRLRQLVNIALMATLLAAALVILKSMSQPRAGETPQSAPASWRPMRAVVFAGAICALGMLLIDLQQLVETPYFFTISPTGIGLTNVASRVLKFAHLTIWIWLLLWLRRLVISSAFPALRSTSFPAALLLATSACLMVAVALFAIWWALPPYQFVHGRLVLTNKRLHGVLRIIWYITDATLLIIRSILAKRLWVRRRAEGR